MKRALIALAGILTLLATSAEAGNWPGWRGPHGTGVADEKQVPLHWSATKNVRWKTPLPSPGNSSPIVWGSQVFITGATGEGRLRTLYCFNRNDGSPQWQHEVKYELEELTHKTNPYCASTPVTDGKRVYVWHGSAGLHAYSLTGEPLWNRDLGKFTHIWGNATSPVLYKNLLILSCGPGMNTFLAAFDRRTGADVWRIEPPTTTSKDLKEFHGSWSTPVLTQVNGQDQLIHCEPLRVVAYEPATGKEIWHCEGLSKLAYTDPLIGTDAIVAMSGYHGPALALRKGGTGDITQTHRLWLHEMKNPQRIGSGVIVDKHAYILNEDGIAWCIEISSGNVRWKKRLGGNNWSSMSHVDGRLYVINMDGLAFVLEPNPNECRILAKNDLDQLTRASLVFSNSQVFVRTYENLYCIETEK